MKIAKNINLIIIACIVLAFTLGCRRSSTSNNQVNIKQFELAKYILYKANTYVNCDCMAIKTSDFEGDVRDTVNVLSVDLTLDTITYQSDTIIYNFNYTKMYDTLRKLQVLSSPYNGCAHYHAVAFINNTTNEISPIYLLAEEDSFVIYSTEQEQKIDAGFKKCFEKHKIDINPWIKSYMKNNPQM